MAKGKRLSTEQLIAIGYLSQPNKGGKTMAEIAEECGVTERTIYNWLNDVHFDAELRRAAKRVVSRYVPDVTKSMMDAAIREGNAAAAKLILQMAEMLTERHEVETTRKDTVDIEELRRLVAEIDD